MEAYRTEERIYLGRDDMCDEGREFGIALRAEGRCRLPDLCGFWPYAGRHHTCEEYAAARQRV